MFCKNCGKFVESDADFCTSCGKKVENSEPETAHEEAVQTASFSGNSKKSKAPIVIAIILIAIVVIAVLAGSGDKYVDLVKGGHLQSYPNMPIGEAFDNFFYDPEWKSFKASDGSMIVEFNGVCTYFNEDTTCTFQFEVSENSGEFEIVYAGFGEDESMSILEMYALLETVEDDYLS
ncbi:MAG: zinc ribbon domain-containing protein [Ruminococcus sp.]|nr:zinc ribbon domain-containing protein [Ruminococcus sp.]